ncbi:MAG TPA: hypothetical protein VGG11_13855 [Xanthobacteraceae bacterium]|jgi:hypothetical protein
MKIKEFLLAIAIIAIGCGLSAAVTLMYERATAPAAPESFGSASDNILPQYPNSTVVYVNSSDTLVVASSTGRQYLQIDNVSGATSTPKVVSCNFGDRPATLYSGFSILASSSKEFTLDKMYRGAIHCIAPASGATLTVTDF